MNICLVSREYPPETFWGGIGRYTYLLARGLANKGHEVHVIVQTFKDQECHYIHCGVYVHKIKRPEFFKIKIDSRESIRRLEYSWRVYKKILELIEKYNIQLVESPNFSAECVIYSLFKKIPLLTRIHTPYQEVVENFGWKWTWDRKLSSFLEKILIKRSNIITCSTSIYAELIRKKYKLKKEKVRVIPLGIELADGEHIKFIEDPKGKFNILFVGRLERRKGVHILMESIPEVIKEIPEVEFIFVGRDTFFQKDESSFRSIRGKSFKAEFYEKLPDEVKEKVHLLGVVSDSELQELYKKCDLFVAPSFHETFGFVYLEAMSYGKPVIGCKVGGVPEVVKHGEVGILVEPSNPRQLAEAIIRLLSQPEELIRMGKAARRWVEENFALERLVNETEKLYEELIS